MKVRKLEELNQYNDYELTQEEYDELVKYRRRFYPENNDKVPLNGTRNWNGLPLDKYGHPYTENAEQEAAQLAEQRIVHKIICRHLHWMAHTKKDFSDKGEDCYFMYDALVEMYERFYISKGRPANPNITDEDLGIFLESKDFKA